MPNVRTTLDEFLAAIEATGITPPDHIIDDGKLHRFSSNGKSGDKAGWYCFHSDGLPAGAFGCWRLGISQTWCAKSDREMTPQEYAVTSQRLEAIHHAWKVEQAERHAAAAKHAAGIVAAATPATDDHPYLRRKQVKSHGLLVDDKNRLIVLVMIDGSLSSLLFIDPTGKKMFLFGGKVAGGSFVIGDLTAAAILLFCEGVATGFSLHEATGLPVICALSAGNMPAAALNVHQQFPAAKILICADRDKSGVGQEAARDAAELVNDVSDLEAIVITPEWADHDFNDVHARFGLGAVSAAINTALWNRGEEIRVVSGPRTMKDAKRMKKTATVTTTTTTKEEEGEDQSAPPLYTPSENTAQLHTPPALKENPNILAEFVKSLAVCGSVGEERCAQLIYLVLTSRLLAQIISLIIKGLSGSGKSYTLEQTLKHFPDTAYIAMTGMSERALIYMPEDFAHKIIVLYEASALKEQKEKTTGDQTAYFVRSLLSEGKISYPVTVRDKEHGWKTTTITKQGPVGLILTTTAHELHGENETRMLSVPTNDTHAQTKAIMRQLAIGTAAIPAEALQAWHDLQTWLEKAEHRVVIPYACYLADRVPPIAVRLRRDFRSLLRLIETHAMLHQCTRARTADGAIVANPADYVAVRGLVADLLASGAGATVPETIRETVQAVHDLIKPGAESEGVTVKAVAGHLKLDRSAASRRIQGARAQGYLLNLEEKRGRPGRYTMGDPLPEETELLPLTVPDLEGVLHTPSPAQPLAHSVSPSDSTTKQWGVQVCASNGVIESHDQPTLFQEGHSKHGEEANLDVD
ncbi:MAG: toprim domain-containing protein [Nitrospirota bacterium]|nr:toprim domain-containing protein [Nitrospirota bacterium]